VDGESHTLKNVNRKILKYCPALYAPMEQEMAVVESKYQVHRIAILL
jgi:hypothetical protein